MGNICHSYKSTSVATARLILQDGELREFSRPVKVSHVLCNAPASFVCDSDDMDFGELVSAVDEDEELQIGQLYFVLPLTCLNRPVRAEEIAALAIKASAALRGTGGGAGPRCCGVEGAEPLEFAIKKDVNRYRHVAVTAAGGGGGGGRRGRSGGGGGGGRVGRRRFVAKLGVIVEEQK